MLIDLDKGVDTSELGSLTPEAFQTNKNLNSSETQTLLNSPPELNFIDLYKNKTKR